MNLEELRIEIDKCNNEIIGAIKKRFYVTREIGKIKKDSNLSSYDKSREDKVINNVRLLAQNSNLNEDMIEDIFRIIMKQVIIEHEELKNANK
ncbi:MAG: chorismate mutase [Rickettsiales bacterium]|nr:chorismate mutase [Rickettsiales bacterium]